MDGAVISGPVTVSYKLTRREYFLASLAYFWRTRPCRVVALLGSTIIILGGLVDLLGGRDNGWILWGAFVLVWLGICHLITSAWRWRSEPVLRGSQHYEIAEDGVRCKTAISEATLAWPFFKKVIEYERFYLIVAGRRGASPILKRAFAGPADEARFRDLVARHLPAKLR